MDIKISLKIDKFRNEWVINGWCFAQDNFKRYKELYMEHKIDIIKRYQTKRQQCKMTLWKRTG